MLLRILPRKVRLTIMSIAAILTAMAASAATLAQRAPVSPSPARSVQGADAPSATMTEDELKQVLVGKTFYLRGGYLDDALSFNERGLLDGHSPQGSYTLNLIRIEKVHLDKRRLEIEGVRFGLHFLGALPSEDTSAAFDRVRITPPKKMVRISIDRERVVKPKKRKQDKRGKGTGTKGAMASTAAEATTAQPISGDTTTSPAHAAEMLRDALDRIFAPNLDTEMIAAMPRFWQLYYKAAAAKTDYHPSNPSVLRQDQVDRRARLLTSFEPDSNQYAQNAGVAGLALYHVVIGPDGKPGEIAVARPIGFGLDENAVAAILKTRFQPAIKSGKPVAVLVDLIVEFRIYSKRTEAASTTASQPAQAPKRVLPGPYSAGQPH